MQLSPLRCAWALASALAFAGTATAAEPEPKYSPWQSNQHSWFAASASDVGIIYARPHLTLGWGAPFWHFVGIDGYALSTNAFASGYVGWRANLPFLDVQWGARWVYPYDRRYLPIQKQYGAEDLLMGEGDERSTYRVVELEITPIAPAPGGGVFAEIHPIWIDAPKDRYLYEEMLRAVVVPPFAMRTRLGYVFDLQRGGVKVGAMTEYIVTPGRPRNATRLGPLLIVSISQYVEALATATFVVDSPDELGIYEGTYGFMGARLRWVKRFGVR